ncbi:hypothetical protein TVAG_223200 [Trichomonas vaginalis G3]|uniref:Uncharacterized protein n=1 Tax=Trichomonas vaginalis (strain ATCC PRA-98 / G3) TaxID=412133 RepID=A2FZ13_TRIV3|nr:hypothetical protein TVAGG3_0134480 [Trichomonas vaginalis G3]EAX89853.1 hypothetical protein TVAG_223200 [Trichomonas vaginalis G3]KAI5546304.1 hypothetical protein TVAGG3_0134480 [Trichomonas vaginalis G3]|eukprot:XP_001302783.1 hypothetical protein [Trichomonas vaginalis G3]
MSSRYFSSTLSGKSNIGGDNSSSKIDSLRKQLYQQYESAISSSEKFKTNDSHAFTRPPTFAGYQTTNKRIKKLPQYNFEEESLVSKFGGSSPIKSRYMRKTYLFDADGDDFDGVSTYKPNISSRLPLTKPTSLSMYREKFGESISGTDKDISSTFIQDVDLSDDLFETNTNTVSYKPTNTNPSRSELSKTSSSKNQFSKTSKKPITQRNDRFTDIIHDDNKTANEDSIDFEIQSTLRNQLRNRSSSHSELPSNKKPSNSDQNLNQEKYHQKSTTDYQKSFNDLPNPYDELNKNNKNKKISKNNIPNKKPLEINTESPYVESIISSPKILPQNTKIISENQENSNKQSKNIKPTNTLDLDKKPVSDGKQKFKENTINSMNPSKGNTKSDQNITTKPSDLDNKPKKEEDQKIIQIKPKEEEIIQEKPAVIDPLYPNSNRSLNQKPKVNKFEKISSNQKNPTLIITQPPKQDAASIKPSKMPTFDLDLNSPQIIQQKTDKTTEIVNDRSIRDTNTPKHAEEKEDEKISQNNFEKINDDTDNSDPSKQKISPTKPEDKNDENQKKDIVISPEERKKMLSDRVLADQNLLKEMKKFVSEEFVDYEEDYNEIDFEFDDEADVSVEEDTNSVNHENKPEIKENEGIKDKIQQEPKVDIQDNDGSSQNVQNFQRNNFDNPKFDENTNDQQTSKAESKDTTNDKGSMPKFDQKTKSPSEFPVWQLGSEEEDEEKQETNQVVPHDEEDDLFSFQDDKSNKEEEDLLNSDADNLVDDDRISKIEPFKSIDEELKVPNLSQLNESIETNTNTSMFVNYADKDVNVIENKPKLVIQPVDYHENEVSTTTTDECVIDNSIFVVEKVEEEFNENSIFKFGESMTIDMKDDSNIEYDEDSDELPSTEIVSIAFNRGKLENPIKTTIFCLIHVADKILDEQLQLM